MKKIVLLLLSNLLIVTSCFSENIYPQTLNDSLVIITNKQLKQTNLIFLEHKKFKLEIEEFKKQINSYDSLILNYQQADVLQNNLINDLEEYSKNAANTIAKQEKNIKQYNKLKYILTGSVIANILMVVLLTL